MAWTNVLSDEEVASLKKLRQKAYQRQWEKDNPEKVKANQKKSRQKYAEKLKLERKKKWASADKAKSNEAVKQWRLKNPSAHQNIRLKRQFGITKSEWDEMLISQGSCCAICERAESGGKRGWNTDHCHETGIVRGILCNSCNVALGHFKDDIKILYRAIVYLERTK